MIERIVQWLRKRGLEVHGNWCGPRHQGPEGPTDPLDATCRAHDFCYVDAGRLPYPERYLAEIQCDLVLIEDIQANVYGNKEVPWSTRLMARVIVFAFTLRPDVRRALKD